MPNPKDEPDDLYDLAPTPPPPEPRPALPIDPAETRPIPAYRSRAQDRTAKADPEQIKNFYMPIWLLGVGVSIEIIAAFIRERTAAEALVYVSVELIAGTIITLIGILIAARIRQIKLGSFWNSVFKLSAISVAPAAAVDLIQPILNILPTIPFILRTAISLGGIIGLGIKFICFFALLGVMFDLDESDTWYFVWTIFLVHLALYFTALAIGLRA